MKCSVSFAALALCATAVFAQNTSTPATSSAGTGLQPRGPEAIAQQTPNKVVATIDGKPITAQQAVSLINSLPPADRKRYENNLSALVQQIYMEDQLAADAEKEKLDQEAPYKQQLAMARTNILTQAYIAQLLKDAAAAQQAEQYYKAHPAEFDQVKVSGIVIAFNAPGTPASSALVNRTEADAQAKAMDIEKKLKAGGDFSALARTDSDQQQSATKGGDMGSFVMADSNVPEEIKAAVAKLQPGQISEPVRAKGGYIILKLDTRTRLDFDKVKQGLIEKLALDKYKIHVDDEAFFSAPPAPNVPSLAAPRSGTGTGSGTASNTTTKPPAK